MIPDRFHPALVFLAVAAFCLCAWAASIWLAAGLFLVIAGGFHG